MKKIICLLIIMALSLASFSLVSYAATTPEITMEYEVLTGGKIEATIYLNGGITTTFTGYGLAIKWDPALVSLTKNTAGLYAVINADSSDGSHVEKSIAGNLADWSSQTTGVVYASKYFEIGLKDTGNPPTKGISVTSDTKLELAKVYFTLASGVTTLEDKTPFSSYVKTGFPAVSSQINYLEGATAKSVKTSGTVNFFTFTDITTYGGEPEPLTEIVGSGFGTNVVVDSDATQLTVSGTAAILDANGACGIKLSGGSIVSSAFFPAYEAENETNFNGKLLKNGKFAIILEGIKTSVLTGDGNTVYTVQPVTFDGTDYTNVGDAFTFKK